MKKSVYSEDGYHGYKIKLKLIRERSKSYKPVHIHTPQEVYDFLKNTLVSSDKERVISILLDNRNKIIGVDEVSIGTLNSSIVHPREIFKSAILSNATSFILAHNHPSGDPDPSREDLELTKTIQKASEFFGIDLLDHIVIGNGNFISFKDRGYL